MRRTKATLDSPDAISRQYGVPANEKVIQHQLELLASYIQDFGDNIWFIEIINELKNKGYKVGLLSNLRLMDYKRYEEQIKKINFDYIFLSYKMKCIKPSNDIYLQVINTLKCDPDNIIFFDDNEKNVNIANQLGINAYQVTGENIKEVFYKKINI